MSAKYECAEPVTGVNLYQVSLIQSSFDVFCRKKDTSMKTVCVYYALDNPDSVGFCPHLSGKTGKSVVEAVRSDAPPACMAKLYWEMAHMCTQVCSLRTPDVFAEVCKLQLPCKHPFNLGGYEKLNKAWLKALREELGAMFDEMHHQAWEAFLNCPGRKAAFEKA